MPVMLRTTPNKSAIASPASTASTTGRTKSSEVRTKINCVETEFMVLGSGGLNLTCRNNVIGKILSNVKYSLWNFRMLRLRGYSWHCRTESSHYRNEEQGGVARLHFPQAPPPTSVMHSALSDFPAEGLDKLLAVGASPGCPSGFTVKERLSVQEKV